MEEGRRTQVLVAVAAVAVVLDLLLLPPVIVVAARWPALIWWALGPYLLVSLGAISALVYLARRWGVVTHTGAHTVFLRKLALEFGGLTVVFLVVVFLRPGLVPYATGAYVVGAALWVYRLVGWQGRTLALACDGCGAVFTAGTWTWLLSPNMGSRKYVRCRACGRRTLARVVEASGPERR